MKHYILFFFCGFLWATYAQELPLLDRLSAIKNGNREFYAIDGYTITNEDLKLPFDEKGFKKAYRKLKINAQDAQPNPRILTDNYVVNRDKEGYVESLYFVKSPANTITLVWFSKLRDREVEVEEALVNLIVENKIPQELFAPTEVVVLSFLHHDVQHTSIALRLILGWWGGEDLYLSDVGLVVGAQ